MIPSQNDQSLTKESWDKASRSQSPSDFPDFTCDACAKQFRGISGRVTWEYRDAESLAPVIQEIGGVKYFSCGQACSRILFTIHHQYHMRERAQSERFVTITPYTGRMDDPGFPVVVDLDAVSSMQTDFNLLPFDSPTVHLYWQGSGIAPWVGGQIPRAEAQRIMDLWKKKPWRGAVS